jgi:predicted transcriptional regulator
MTKLATKGEVSRLDTHLITMDNIVTEYLKGSKPQDIAKTLGMSYGTVSMYLKEWRQAAANNDDIKERAHEALVNADEHFTRLISNAYSAMEDAVTNGSNPQRMQAIRLIADLEKSRLDSLHRAGLLEDSELSRQIVETERKQEVLMDILKNTIGECDHCRPIVQEKLAAVAKEVVIVHSDV